MLINIMDLKLEHLEILYLSDRRDSRGKAYWWCKCVCGREFEVLSCSLRKHRTKSCGCINFRKKKHGATGTPEYNIWNAMRNRCRNGSKNYGVRGITVCERWDDFTNFIADMGPRPSNKHSIERRDSDGMYEPENCYWATAIEQNRNIKHNHYITHNGLTLTVSEWGRRLSMKQGVISGRLNRGWSEEQALSTPIDTAHQRSWGNTTSRKRHPEYGIWVDMKRRCADKSNKSYGGRGIKVCEQWLNSFDAFLADVGDRPSKRHSLDRINNNGDYCPDNCKWATTEEQSRNKTTSRYITHNGETKTLSQWASEIGINPTTLHNRLKRLRIEDALTMPSKHRHLVQLSITGRHHSVNDILLCRH